MSAPADGPVVHGDEQTPPTREVVPFTCGGCDAAWTALTAAHCSACHQTFASVPLFDAHRSQEGEHGTCLAPSEVVGRDGDRRLFFRSGMWRGPEMPEERREQLRRMNEDRIIARNTRRLGGGGRDGAIPA